LEDPDYTGRPIEGRRIVVHDSGAVPPAWHVTPFWNFVVDKVLGRAAGPEPYVRDESNAQVLGSDASYVTAERAGPADGSLSKRTAAS
jgi:hypothetical protein